MHCTNTPCKEPLDLKWTATTGYIRMGSNPSAPHPPTFVSLTSRPHLLYRNCSASLRIQKSQDALSLPQCPMSCWSPAPASIRPRTPRHSPTINRTSSLLHSHESSRQYCARDFLRIARFQAAVVCACDLYYIPSQSSCYHEFLLVNVDAGHEKLMLIIERVPTNNGVMVVSSSGGVARDTITVVRAKECHEYWQRASQRPLCKGTLRWDHTPPHLLDIAFIASAASTTFWYYNLYIRQCYWYARITLAAMARAFPSCSSQGNTSFSRGRFTMFGRYKPSQVQLLVDLHTISCRDLHPPVNYLAPVTPAFETESHAFHFTTPDILHDLAVSIASFQSSLARLTFLEPVAHSTNRHGDRVPGGISDSGGWTDGTLNERGNRRYGVSEVQVRPS